MKRPDSLVVAGAMSLSFVICLTVPSSSSVRLPTVAKTKLEAASRLNMLVGRRGLSYSLPKTSSAAMVANHFTVLGHDDLGAVDTHGDVWVHGDFAYVGTWSEPCSGLGLKVVDVSNLRAPRMIGRLAAREGTSAEDVVVRSVRTRYFRGDLLATGIQRCGDDPALDGQTFGVEFWDVSNPIHPRKLSEFGITHGRGGVHELDLFQRGDRVYALLASPWTEWFDAVPGGDFRIVDATDPAHPIQVGEWGAGAHGLSPGPFFGLGSFGSAFAHSARASADGKQAYVSYWDLGVLTFDISDPANPVLQARTRYAPDDDGDGHSVSPYEAKHHRRLLLQNDEDFDPTSPTHILFGSHDRGLGVASASGPAIWELPGHTLTAPVIEAANDGCAVADYPAETVGKIAVVHTPFPFFDGIGDFPLCDETQQEQAAAAAGAVAVVHDFVAYNTSPQPFNFAPVSIPVLFTDHTTAQGMVVAGSATLQGQTPSWGFLRVFDAETGVQVAKFDGVANVHALPPPPGFWSIHNIEVADDRGFASWYSNGIVVLDLRPLDRKVPGAPELIGQFIPPAAPPRSPFLPEAPIVWGVAIRLMDAEDNGRSRARDMTGPASSSATQGDEGKARKIKHPIVFASDMSSGLWIIEPNSEPNSGKAASASIEDERAVESIAQGGRPSALGSVQTTAGQPVKAFELASVMPNPTFGEAGIEFALPIASRVRLRVLDPQGRVVARLAEGIYPAGVHHTVWSGSGDRDQVPAGIYFVQFETPERSFVKRIVRMR